MNNDRAVKDSANGLVGIVKDYTIQGLDDGQRAPEKRPYVH